METGRELPPGARGMCALKAATSDDARTIGEMINPGSNNFWDLRGNKFYLPTKKPLDCWGVGYLAGKRNAANKTHIEAFINSMM
ncbi:hypothetical protein BJY04DRAFT_192396 [Aspergillus karnatakaensis]|uniref:uncharacterized protein n=1 Tax=Aspergillus karnatakaensis TaxID=1810916 RepID=UPI003CCE0165